MGPVWFLAGSFGATVVRSCLVPAGKALFFPLVNQEWDNIVCVDPDTSYDVAGLRAIAATTIDLSSGLAVTVDVAVEWDVWRLAETARRRFGPIDLFCSNAGTALGPGAGGLEGGPFVPDDVWQKSWDVNVMAHVYAARSVLPEMIARGQGWWLFTASAAGLLTDMGALAYSVTKHATVAFAEWLAIHYGDEGVGVSCLCPQGVRTPMLTGAEGSGVAEHLLPGMLEPEAVADAVVEGLSAERFLILPHPEVKDYFLRKASDYDRWLRGMRRVRARLYGKGESH
jgi:NAD(P)-dependent dehydrogenase (short-subunit alcohol dehydrogenase family)